MGIGGEPKIAYGPADAGSGSGGREKWPDDIPEYCKGTEVHLNEPHHSYGDGMAKGLSLVRMSLDDDEVEKIQGLNNLKASLFWLDRSIAHYTDKPEVAQEFSKMKPLLERLITQVENNDPNGIRELAEQVGQLDDSIDKVFQVETGKLLSPVVVALFPLIQLGLSRKILDVITKHVEREKVVSLLQLIEDHKAGKANDEQFKTSIETLFAEELKD